MTESQCLKTLLSLKLIAHRISGIRNTRQQRFPLEWETHTNLAALIRASRFKLERPASVTTSCSLKLFVWTTISLSSQPLYVSFAQLRRLLIHSTATLIHLDLATPLTIPCAAAEPRRRRGRNVPTLADLNPWARPELTKGTNGRTLTLSEPTIAVAHMGGGAVLLMEKPWEDVLEGMPAPLFRRRYGS